MSTTIESYKLDFPINSTDEIVLLHTVIMNINNETRSVYSTDALNVFKILNNHNVKTIFSETDSSKRLYQDHRSTDWLAPAIFLSKLVLENPETVQLIIDILTTYVKEKLKHITDAICECSIVIEDKNKGTYKMANYKGHVSGMKELNNILKTMQDGNN